MVKAFVLALESWDVAQWQRLRPMIHKAHHLLTEALRV